jgi:hypothetical protein
MKNIFFWLPRVLSILFIIFVSIFALDVFGQPQWFMALLIHLIPSFILIILAIIAWKKELLGGLLFLIAGLAMLIFYHSVVIFLPAFVIGTIFLISAKRFKK